MADLYPTHTGAQRRPSRFSDPGAQTTSNDANPERQSFLTAPTAVPDRDDYLQSAQDHRRDRNHEQDRPIEARKVRPVLVLNSLEVRLAKEERSVEIESRQADLAIRVAQGDVSVCDVA
ncbi:uncharacterized protein FFC1_03801 [Fusarium fujikuroi]|nr:uncharacterized protein FFC1_03801 [Fusarium fujikuroi]